ncbi:serine/threonine-protein phosphatase [Xanthomonas sp. NCPPB 2654]|uniref:PP2C family protein-serine/threonine phosphatase n=1 Tax=unclassified Xanthomonas TaxID=2643310 RepID=UPI0021E05B05|nr:MULTISPECIES: PP2C family serine/threonine-protein phosphatase [unclassified Xanthomonas]MDL5364038.1 serine/threonine-protein phosphatase [Xanthomonas sp. NCPPB 2654]UYC20960.1 serine/threonine-protein phosphatase [Xanthomonas sp. CFBP 8443]
MAALHYRSAGRTETGKVRRHNEDALLLRDDAGLWVVADGLGGHAAGDYASGLIVERLATLPRAADVCDFIEAIEDALAQINTELLHCAEQRQVDMIASTVVLLVHDPDFMLYGWVGDSRGYGRIGGALRQLTRDHVHGVKDDATQFGQAGAGAEPAANAGVLTRAVGAQEPLFVDWVLAPSVSGAQFLLCSDGINKEIPDPELDVECRLHGEPQALLARLFELAMGRAARDNVTAVVVRLQE